MQRKETISFTASAVQDLEDIRFWYADQQVPAVGDKPLREMVSQVERLGEAKDSSRCRDIRNEGQMSPILQNAERKRSMVDVREATMEDREAVLNLLQQLMQNAVMAVPDNRQNTVEAYRRIVEEDQGTILLAVEDGRYLGLVTLSYPLALRYGGVYSCIEEFIVGEQARGKGVGSMLLSAAIDKAREKGSYELQVNRPSEMGYPVYVRNGWSDLGKHLSLAIASLKN